MYIPDTYLGLVYGSLKNERCFNLAYYYIGRYYLAVVRFFVFMTQYPIYSFNVYEFLSI